MSDHQNGPKSSKGYDTRLIDTNELKRAQQEANQLEKKRGGGLKGFLPLFFGLAALAVIIFTGVSLSKKGYRVSITNTPPVPFQDVESDQAAALGAVTEKPWDPLNPGMMLVQSPSNPAVFYLASNAPATENYLLKIEGIEGTLLNPPSPNFHFEIPIQLSHSFFQTAPLTSANGSPIPRGMYRIQVIDTAGIPVSGIVSFLGGKKDASYFQELKNAQAAAAAASAAAAAAASAAAAAAAAAPPIPTPTPTPPAKKPMEKSNPHRHSHYSEQNHGESTS